MRYRVLQDLNTADEWRVEVIAQDGLAYSAYCAGPQAEQRAQAFADRKNFATAVTRQRAA